MQRMLIRMTSRKDAQFFKVPVDWEGLGLLDYLDIIKVPMVQLFIYAYQSECIIWNSWKAVLVFIFCYLSLTSLFPHQDFQTISKKLERNEYSSQEEAADDVRLIFHNAMTYNIPGSRVYVDAKTLSEFFEQNWATIVKLDSGRPPTSEQMTEWAEMCHRYRTL